MALFLILNAKIDRRHDKRARKCHVAKGQRSDLNPEPSGGFGMFEGLGAGHQLYAVYHTMTISRI